ncbi:MAG TPA: hypothetical protein VJ327_03185 [Patescibacteria group bacterium]|nr:hypothetical protein [Patescibacteria group bacterium]
MLTLPTDIFLEIFTWIYCDHSFNVRQNVRAFIMTCRKFREGALGVLRRELRSPYLRHRFFGEEWYKYRYDEEDPLLAPIGNSRFHPPVIYWCEKKVFEIYRTLVNRNQKSYDLRHDYTLKNGYLSLEDIGSMDYIDAVGCKKVQECTNAPNHREALRRAVHLLPDTIFKILVKTSPHLDLLRLFVSALPEEEIDLSLWQCIGWMEDKRDYPSLSKMTDLLVGMIQPRNVWFFFISSGIPKPEDLDKPWAQSLLWRLTYDAWEEAVRWFLRNHIPVTFKDVWIWELLTKRLPAGYDVVRLWCGMKGCKDWLVRERVAFLFRDPDFKKRLKEMDGPHFLIDSPVMKTLWDQLK